MGKNRQPSLETEDEIQIEKQKVDTDEDSKHKRKSIYKSRFFFQASVGRVIAAGLFAAWVIGYLNPILTAQSKVNEQQNKVALLQIEEQKIYLQRIKHDLESSQQAHKRELELLQVENKTLQDQLTSVRSSFSNLEKKYKETEELKAELKQLKKVEKYVVDSETRIDEQIERASKSREQTLQISWVKPSDWIGRHYHLKIDDGVYLWPTMLDSDKKKAKVIVNTSNRGRDKGTIILEEEVIHVGKEIVFNFNEAQYKLKLLSIRKAGRLPTDAGYFEAEKIK